MYLSTSTHSVTLSNVLQVSSCTLEPVWGTGPSPPGSLWFQREPNCVKLIKSDRCVCFHSWLRCSAQPPSLCFIQILPKSIKDPVFNTLTLPLIKLGLIVLAGVWRRASADKTGIHVMNTSVLRPLFWAACNDCKLWKTDHRKIFCFAQ